MERRDPRASDLMRKMYQLVREEATDTLTLQRHVYVWMDSVLLFAYLDESPGGVSAILREVNGLKEKIDGLLFPEDKSGRSFVIAVQGRPFQDVENVELQYGYHAPTEAGVQVTIVQASSYAFANCFEIEKAIRKEIGKTKNKEESNKWSWYLDPRIVERSTPPRKKLRTIEVKLLRRTPSPALISVFDGFPYDGLKE